MNNGGERRPKRVRESRTLVRSRSEVTCSSARSMTLARLIMIVVEKIADLTSLRSAEGPDMAESVFVSGQRKRFAHGKHRLHVLLKISELTYIFNRIRYKIHRKIE